MAPAAARTRPTGRRAGDSGTRDAILDAALALFSEHGHDGASIRAIAAAAGVDPALVRHFFGDKDTLFATVLADRTAIPQRLSQAAAADPADIGRAVTDTYLRLWEQPDTRPVLLALVRSATTSPHAAQMLREALIARATALTDLDRAPRVALAAAHLLGIAIARHVFGLPQVADLSHDDLVAEVAPTIQRYLTGTHR